MSHLFKLAGFFALICPAAAFAHIGHIGELAGHGHLIGLGGLVAAAALAALVAKLSADKAKSEDGLEDRSDDEIADGADGSAEETETGDYVNG